MTELNLTIKELCDVVEGKCSLDPSFLVRNILSLERASANDLAVVFDPEDNSVFTPLSSEKVKQSKAGVLLASGQIVSGKEYVFVTDPLVALEKLANFVKTRKTIRSNPSIQFASHQDASQTTRDERLDNSSSPLVPSDLQGKSYRGISQWAIVEDNVSIGAGAVIEDDAKIGYGATIGANVFVGQGAVVGCGVVLHPGVKILERSVVGDNTIIHSGAVIGSDGFGYRVMKTGLRKITHIGIVIIGKSVEIGANTTIDRAEFDQTVIGDGVKLDNQVHIAHNVKIGPHTAILAQTGIAGSTIIGAGCQIGGQVAIKDHLTIGNEVKIVSKSAVMKNLKDGEIVCGIPSMPFSQWKRMMVALARLPELLKKNRTRKTFWQKLFS